jgi:hypothetical protein
MKLLYAVACMLGLAQQLETNCPTSDVVEVVPETQFDDAEEFDEDALQAYEYQD